MGVASGYHELMTARRSRTGTPGPHESPAAPAAVAQRPVVAGRTATQNGMSSSGAGRASGRLDCFANSTVLGVPVRNFGSGDVSTASE